jgi:hypothetical protein
MFGSCDTMAGVDIMAGVMCGVNGPVEVGGSDAMAGVMCDG